MPIVLHSKITGAVLFIRFILLMLKYLPHLSLVGWENGLGTLSFLRGLRQTEN